MRPAAIGCLAGVAVLACACGTGTLASQSGGSSQPSGPASAALGAVDNALRTTSQSKSFAFTLSVGAEGMPAIPGVGSAGEDTSLISGTYSSAGPTYEVSTSSGVGSSGVGSSGVGSSGVGDGNLSLIEDLGSKTIYVSGATSLLQGLTRPSGILPGGAGFPGMPAMPVALRGLDTELARSPHAWVEVDVARLPSSLASSIDSMLGSEGDIAMPGSGSLGSLAGLSRYLTAASIVGSATVAGVPTTEYAVTVNTAPLLQQGIRQAESSLGSSTSGIAGAPQDSAGKQVTSAMARAMTALIPKSVTLDVYVDGSNDVRQIGIVVPLAGLFKALAGGFGELGESSSSSPVSVGTSGSKKKSPPTASTQPDIPGLGAMSKASIVVKIDLSSFGAAAVSIPPSADVIDLTPFVPAMVGYFKDDLAGISKAASKFAKGSGKGTLPGGMFGTSTASASAVVSAAPTSKTG